MNSIPLARAPHLLPEIPVIDRIARRSPQDYERAYAEKS